MQLTATTRRRPHERIPGVRAGGRARIRLQERAPGTRLGAADTDPDAGGPGTGTLGTASWLRIAAPRELVMTTVTPWFSSGSVADTSSPTGFLGGEEPSQLIGVVFPATAVF